MSIRLRLLEVSLVALARPVRLVGPAVLLAGLGALDPASAQITPVCERTPAVQEQIVSSAAVADCADVVPVEHFEDVTYMDFDDGTLGQLQRGDFDGLWNLSRLDLSAQDLEALPAGLFSRMSLEVPVDPMDPTAGTEVKESLLQYLYLQNNRISSIPSGLFSSLTALRELNLSGNLLRSVPGGSSRASGEPSSWSRTPWIPMLR